MNINTGKLVVYDFINEQNAPDMQFAIRYLVHFPKENRESFEGSNKIHPHQIPLIKQMVTDGKLQNGVEVMYEMVQYVRDGYSESWFAKIII